MIDRVRKKSIAFVLATAMCAQPVFTVPQAHAVAGEQMQCKTIEQLTALLAKVPDQYETLGFTADSVQAVKAAVAVAKACNEDTAPEVLSKAYSTLETALGSLRFSTDIFVEKIPNYNQDETIRGADVSTYVVLMDTFRYLNESKHITDEAKKYGFRDWDGNLLDEQGFFNLLAASGINYIRTRVWNDPYDAEGHGYGGGNNDMEKAIKIGQWATNAGMRNLIDFHLSDFWADPSKQAEPKAWKGHTVEQKVTDVSEYITDCLMQFKDKGVDVGMVQVGNETNHGVCGVFDWEDMKRIFDSGCDAIHAFNEANGTDTLAVLHFADPDAKDKMIGIADTLADYDQDGDGVKEGVSYDVFASSCYPSGQITMENITDILETIASNYDKYVMVAENSWGTSLEDGDGDGNGFSLKDDLDYTATVQGQADEVRDVIATVNKVDTVLSNGKRAALGMFYWELAWLPTQYVYDENGNYIESIHQENKQLWEQFGAGWASSYAVEYDPVDAGKWYGGNGNDNQIAFDFVGNPLASLNVFKYVSYGAVAEENPVTKIKCDNIKVPVGSTFSKGSLPQTATLLYSDRSTKLVNVEWKETEVEAIAALVGSNENIGDYIVTGTIVVDGTVRTVLCTVTVYPENLIQDASFEEQSDSWIFDGPEDAVASKQENAQTGVRSAKFWLGEDFSFTVSQTVTAEKAGLYNGYVSAMGKDGVGLLEGERLYLSATTSSGTTIVSDDFSLHGWGTWDQVTMADIPVEAGETITFTIHAENLQAEAWGSFDDACLYWNKEVIADIPEEPEVPEEKITLTDSNVTLSNTSYVYTGKENKPSVTVAVNGKILKQDIDYTVEYQNNTKIGTAHVTVKGIGSYTDKVKKAYKITKASKTGK